uniref:Uncharacterized protein n=1 Tax=Heterorhabditis bacteriophora TaxID=37862 RepID=A0A1I7XUA5_HETBA
MNDKNSYNSNLNINKRERLDVVCRKFPGVDLYKGGADGDGILRPSHSYQNGFQVAMGLASPCPPTSEH